MTEYQKEWVKKNPDKVKNTKRKYKDRLGKTREAVRYIKECKNCGLFFSSIIYNHLLELLDID